MAAGITVMAAAVDGVVVTVVAAVTAVVITSDILNGPRYTRLT
jgi:hypothetical protein